MKLFNTFPISRKLAEILRFALGGGAIAVTIFAAIVFDAQALWALVPEVFLGVAAHIHTALKQETPTNS